MAKRRLGRYWSKNEKKVMRKLGLTPVPGSGSGELHKEDGENEFILCQLKSSEAISIGVSRLDVEKLLYHAELVNKIPVFAIQFMDGPMLLATVPEELGNISKYLNEDLFERKQVEVIEIPKQKSKRKVKSSEMTFDEVYSLANESLDEDEVEEQNDDFLSSAFEKRKQRRNKNKFGG